MQYSIHMTEIGYGQTKQQLQYLVKQIIEKDGRPNPFSGNLPGKKWWQLFKQHHSEIFPRKAEHLQLSSVQKKSIPIVSSSLDDILKPDPAKKTKAKSTLDMAKHLTSEQLYQYLELKRTQKEKAKLQKVQHREERALKKKKQEKEWESKKQKRKKEKRTGD